MPRRWLVLALVASVAACTGASYTIEGASIDNANERAARYCSNRAETAQLEHIRKSGDSSIETYRCIAEE
jgi:hypothetical protein